MIHKHERLLKTNNIISKSSVIVLSIVLLTGLALVPALQIGVHAQVQQQPQQQKQVGLSQVIKQIAQQVANANPGTNANDVYQILVQSTKQTAQTYSKEQAIEEIRQISSQIAASPSGTLSQSLAHSAQQLTSSSGAGSSIQATQTTSGFTGNYTGTVSRIVDGDTLYIGKTPIRLSLVNTAELGQQGFNEAKNFTAGLCDVGETAKYNIDDKQKKSYNRTVAVVYCVEQQGQFYNVNEQLILKGHAKVLPKFCSVSEFYTQAWVSQYCNHPAATQFLPSQAADIAALFVLIENLFNLFPNDPTIIQLYNQINNFQQVQTTINQQEINIVKDKVVKVVKEKKPKDREIVCLYNPDHPLCEPDKGGNCPPDWAMNENERCFPVYKKCPSGYERPEDDETGACIKKEPPKQEPPIKCPTNAPAGTQGCTPFQQPPKDECPIGYMKGEAGACIKKEPPINPLPPQQIPNCNDVDPNVAQDCKTDSGQVCEAGTTEDGCELDGYHCTDEQGCGNYEDGICVDCPKNEEQRPPPLDTTCLPPDCFLQPGFKIAEQPVVNCPAGQTKSESGTCIPLEQQAITPPTEPPTQGPDQLLDPPAAEMVPDEPLAEEIPVEDESMYDDLLPPPPPPPPLLEGEPEEEDETPLLQQDTDDEPEEEEPEEEEEVDVEVDDDDSDSEEEGDTPDEEEAAVSDESEDDGGDTATDGDDGGGGEEE